MAEVRTRFREHQIRSEGEGGLRWTLQARDANGKWRHDLWAEIIVGAAGTLIVHGDVDGCTKSRNG